MQMNDRYNFLLALLSAHDQTPPWTGSLVGCTLSSRDNQPLISYHNIITEYKRPSLVHVEMRCIIWALQNSISIDECCLYITTAPCDDCASVIKSYGLRVKFLQNWRGKNINSKFESFDPSPVLEDMRSCLPNSPILIQYWNEEERRKKFPWETEREGI